MRRTVVAHCIKEEQGLITKHPKQKLKIKFWNRPRATEKKSWTTNNRATQGPQMEA